MIKREIGHYLGRNNALGILRLIFASLVIVSHTSEIVDGDDRREPLHNLFGTISLGVLAVDAFFVISGYLIVMSYVNSSSLRSYILKRCTRIYPGFIVASLISLLIFSPLVGASWSYIAHHLPLYIGKIAALQYLEVPNTFSGLAHTEINGAVWTIAYEFRCYLIVVVIGMLGGLQRPMLLAVIAILMMAGYIGLPNDWLRSLGLRLPLSRVWLGWLDVTLRLTAIFLIGSLFYLWRSRITFTVRGGILAGAAVVVTLSFPITAEAGVAVFGGYLIFAFAYWGRGTRLSAINNKNDISYGTYLYGWPIGACFLWAIPTMPLPLVMAATILLAMLAGWASWHIVEKPAIEFMTAWRKGREN